MRTKGITADSAGDIRSAKDCIVANYYDLLLLDIGLPDGNGLDLLQFLNRSENDTAVIILSARGGVEDKVKGLELGSDDYLPKPFSMLELTARIHAVLRRKFKLRDNIMFISGLEIHLDSNTVKVNGRFMEITDTEYRILRYLALNKNKTVTRFALSEHIWGDKVDDRYSLDFISSHMKNLRRKFSIYKIDDPIKTVYGIGYRMEDP